MRLPREGGMGYQTIRPSRQGVRLSIRVRLLPGFYDKRSRGTAARYRDIQTGAVVITQGEREELDGILAAIRRCGIGIEPEREATRWLVDMSRDNLPDLPDVTIGRLLLHLGHVVCYLTSRGYDVREIENIFALCAVDFLAEELV